MAGRYQSPETPATNHVQRTEWNARDSDGTVVISTGERLTGGFQKTVELAQKQGRPALHLSQAGGVPVVKAVPDRTWSSQ